MRIIQSAITQADINEYVTHYSAPGGMRAGFEYYRAFPQEAIQNMNYSKTKLTMAVLALGGGYNQFNRGNITMSPIIYAMKILAQDVRGRYGSQFRTLDSRRAADSSL